MYLYIYILYVFVHTYTHTYTQIFAPPSTQTHKHACAYVHGVSVVSLLSVTMYVIQSYYSKEHGTEAAEDAVLMDKLDQVLLTLHTRVHI